MGVGEGHRRRLRGEELRTDTAVENLVAQVGVVDLVHLIEAFAHRVAQGPQAGIVLEQAADDDGQAEGEQDAGDLPPVALQQRQEHGVGDDQRIGELQQPGEALAEEGIVAGRQHRAQIDRDHQQQPGEVLGDDLVAPSPQHDEAGKARWRAGQRHLGRDRQRHAEIKAKQEDHHQHGVDEVEPARRCGGGQGGACDGHGWAIAETI